MTSPMPDEKILERIRKLHAKAVSAKEIGSEAEALIFMDAVQKMLAKYDLDMTDVEFELSINKDPVDMEYVPSDEFATAKQGTGAQDVVQQLLAAAVCRLFHCAFVRHTGRDKKAFFIVGRREHREVAVFMSVTLIRLMEDLAQKNYVTFFYKCKAEGDVSRARGYKAAFRQGFASAIALRVQQIIHDRDKAGKGNSTALVRLQKEEELLSDFFTKMKEKKVIKDTKSLARGRSTDNDEGFSDGKKHGNDASLGNNAMKGNTSQTKRLGSGNG